MNLAKVAARIAARDTPDSEILGKYLGKPGVYFSWAGGVNDAEPDTPFGLSLNRNRSDYNNHWGVWVYKLTPDSLEEQFGSGKDSIGAYGMGSRDLYVLRVKHPNRMLVVSQYTDGDYRRDLAKLIELGLCDDKVDSQVDARQEERRELEDEPDENLNLPFQRLEDAIAVCRGLSGYKRGTPEWDRSVYTKLGYVGIDDELGLIDTNGNVAVIFDIREIDILEQIHRTDSYRENNRSRGVQNAWRKALRAMRSKDPHECFAAFVDFVSAYYKLGNSYQVLESSPMTAKLVRLLADALVESGDDVEAFMEENGFPLLADELKKRDDELYGDLPVAYSDLEEVLPLG